MGKPELVDVHVAPLSVERQMKPSSVPAKRLVPLMARDVTDWLDKPVLTESQLAPPFVDRKIPFLRVP